MNAITRAIFYGVIMGSLLFLAEKWQSSSVPVPAPPEPEPIPSPAQPAPEPETK